MIYREDDWTAEVEILEDNSNKVWLSYRLKVVKTLVESRMYKPPPDGHVFTADKRRDCEGLRIWTLSEDSGGQS